MKKILFVAVLALSALSMSAQDSKLMFKAGFGLSTLAGSDADGEKNAFA